METALEKRPPARELLRAAIRLPLFLRVPQSQVDASWMQILALVALSVAIPTAYAVVTIGSEGRVATTYLPGVLFHVAVMLLAAAVMSQIMDRGGSVRIVLAASLVAWIPIDAVDLAFLSALDKWSTASEAGGWFMYLLPIGWLALAIARFTITLSPSPMWKKAAVVIASIVVIGAPLGSSLRERSLWTMDWEKKASQYGADLSSRAFTEEALYKQPELLRAQFDQLKPSRQGVTDVYLVAIAGYGAQDVFMHEVESVAKLFRERFDADGRIVTLVNNPKTALTYPLATQTSLDATLKEVAAKMDRDEDVLVLYLTSHGSKDHKFSLQLGSVELKDLTPESVRQALDASGIRNRVVIISACYAGGFVPALKDDNTLVIAAAAPDKVSFGCSNENEWTYFGKAYFDEALRGTTSFTRAFETAKPAIEQRERKDGFDPSNPMMAEGSAIKVKLAELDRQLNGAAQAPVSAPPEKVVASMDKAERYVGLLFQPEITEGYYAICKDNMVTNGPEKTLERAPETLGGLTHSSSQWPRLVAAWDHYAEEVCRRMNDPKLYRDAYLQQVRNTMTDDDLDAGLRLLESKDGQHWYALEKRMTTGLSVELSRRQGEIQERFYKDFVGERDRLFADATRRH
jgi:hypothetical protein